MALVLISLSAFGADAVRRDGQAALARLALEAGADGVEVRSELLSGDASEIGQLVGLTAVYSCADPLWLADGGFDEAALDLALGTTSALRAPRLKMSIGGFGVASHESLQRLAHRLAACDIELLIENDQTASAGTLDRLQRFFVAQRAAGLDLGMTFDMGNWHWQGECPLLSAHALASHVRYVHCKGVAHRQDRWVAVPIVQSAAPWRAVLRSLSVSAAVPMAIEYPLAGEDLLALVRRHVDALRDIRRATDSPSADTRS